MGNAFFAETVDRYAKYILPTYAPQTMFVKGQGVYLFDADGRRYLDFASGISVCNLGHCHPRVTAAIQKQAAELVHISNLYYNPVTPRLAETLIKQCFDGAVFFANSGAEANEGIIKLARKYGNRTGRNEIITMENSFHGRTLATLAATGRAKYRKGFEPDVQGFKQVPYNDFEALKAAVTDKTCGIMLEIVQGEGGILPADHEYLRKVRALCDEKDILMMCDEVQCGMGRTGTLFAWQGTSIEPDVFSMAKALANGIPMGGFIVKRKFTDVLTAGTHASTFGGTPLASAAALAVQETIRDEHLLENCREQGAYLMENLRRITAGYDFVKCVRGKGLMIGVVLDHPAGALSKVLLEKNLVTLTAGETVLRLLPPIILTREQADEGLTIIAAGLKQYAETKKGA